MALEIKLGDRIAQIKLISKKSKHYKIRINDKDFEIDAAKLADGVYSILYNNKSYNISLVKGDNNKKVTANVFNTCYDMELIDSESRYQKNRNKGKLENNENNIVSPMPGKIVKILVKEGDAVVKGQTVIVISAMKMESEYKAYKDTTVKKALVNEGDTVNSNQVLIEFND